MDLITTIEDTPEMSTEDRIRAAAHQLWEDEGRPEGRADDHWNRACEMIAAQEQPTILQVEPEWLQRSPDAPEIVEEPVSEKTELTKSFDDIKKRMIGRAA
jgi:Protein of unknown function (DUF2934)